MGKGHAVMPDQAAAEAAWVERILPRTYLTLPPAASGLTTPCRVWTGYRNANGYGRLWVACEDGGRRRATAHRVALQAYLGEPLPPPTREATVDHLCGNRACCEPTHLELVTARENTLRGDSPAADRATRRWCPHGHPLSGSNLYRRRDGHRQCWCCITKRNRARSKAAA